ncbi:unnamed protein product [Nesidiocoris tenuis]|uniref:SecA DEAD-like N-terminal domain-containing protein n=1 Tax=Nesidiocoris tenuis TaxID=355587 RepID=A0A6H5GCI8_9HEMI|nr:unnamed protein product [Nesidiocoris tenuis]
MEQKSSTPDPPEAGQDSPQEFADDDNGAKDSFSDSDNCVSQINNDNKKYPNGIESLKKVVPTTNGAVNMIEVKQNSNKTNEVHEAQIVLNDLSGMLVSESGRKHLRSKIIQIACSDDTSSEDELVENCPDNGNRNIDCHPSTAEAVDRTTEIASSEVEHRRSNLGLGKKYWFFDLGQFVKCQLFGCIIHELYSCQLLCDRCTVYIRKQEGGGYLLTIDEQRFVARVAIHPLDDLNLSNFDFFKRKILARIQVIRVLEDEMLEGRNQSATKFAKVLEEAVTCEINGQSTQVFLLCLSDIKDQEPLKSLELLSTNQSVPAELRSASGELLVKERSFIARNFPIMLRQNSSPAELRDIIQQFYSLGIERYGKWLMDYCPPALPRLKNEVEKLSPKIQLFVSRADVSVFHHLITIASEPEILPFFEYLLDDFFDCVKSINNRSSFADETPLVNPVLGFLFKSFWEIMAEIRRIVGTCDFKDLLIKRGNHWGLMDLIQWPIPQHGGRHPVQHVFRSLECQYQFVFKLMKHYYPSGTWKSSGFQYQMQLQNKKQPWWKQVYTTLTQGCNSHLKDVCEERKIWLYIMDHTIEQVVIDRICSFEEFFNYYEPVMIFHCKFVTKSIGESQESFRLATHSILKYIVQTSPFLHESDVGRDILSQQLSYLTRMVEKKTIDESPFSDIRDLITEYIKLWELRHELDCLHKGVPDFLAGQLNELVGIILRMVFDCLGESAPIKSLSMFLNRVNEFLTDFQNMALANAWYVKSKDPNHRGLTKVMNRIADEPDCSYLVTNVNTYLTSIGDSGRPPHYNIQIIRKLLDCVNVALEKTWVTDEEPVVGKLDAASTLLGAIRGSLIYMKEQPDYRDFTKYEKDSTKMFVRAVDTCPDLISFKKRVGVISESCWYLRKKDEIGVERALEMLEPMFGDGINKNILEMCYLRYANKFLEHVENTASKDSTDGKILHIVNDLKSHRSENSVKKWDKTFKTETVPEILAGLSVIWSLMKSQDVTTGENLLQPHCIQILCALRLFGVDRDHVGAKSHLAQILTGQGKSVVLALVSAVFAVTGHNVFIACYSRYLVARDVSEFEDFFNALDLTNRSSGFDCKNGENYGYLVLDTGRISYAKLPTDFPLIVGVTGTLRNVYDHEKTAMREFYNIINYTDCPSFYGASIVKFYPQLDFRVLDSNDQWRRVLFERAYSQIKVGRAVMIFFERESEITSFAKDFGGKFAALNILTENTDDDAKDRFIDRAGATATLTLASRGIGRGTDFKSSLAVERNGGIHVVQSFFSKDQKEETQIKGRTARKDNKGSYELILCRQHLIDARLLDGAQNTAITYSKLDKSRTALREREGAKTAAEIKSHYIDHATTMKFYGLV